MSDPILFIPGLNCTAELFGPQIAALGGPAEIQVAEHTGHEDMRDLAASILAVAPRRFALVGLSMGGYIAFEMLRQAPERVARVALLDTSARPDTPAQAERRHRQIRLALDGRFAEVAEMLWPLLVHPSRQGDAALRAVVRRMAEETGAEAFVRQTKAIMSRPDSRPNLSRIACPALVLAGAHDPLLPRHLREELAAAIPNARLELIEQASHDVFADDPGHTYRRLREFSASSRAPERVIVPP
jgi:pimeloyl-ACP methyl ester carboxylesterase